MGPASLGESGSGYNSDTVGELGLWQQFSPDAEGGILSIEQGVDAGLWQQQQNPDESWSWVPTNGGPEQGSLNIPLGPDFGQPSYLVVNADGTVGAAFTGEVSAAGLQLQAGSSSSRTPSSGGTGTDPGEIVWKETFASTEYRGRIFTQKVGGGSNTHSSLILEVKNSAGTVVLSRVLASTMGGGSYGSMIAAGCSLRIPMSGSNPVAGTYGWTNINVDDALYDSNGSRSGASWTVPYTGWYDISVQGCWASNGAGGQRGVRLVTVNGGVTQVLCASQVQALPNGFATEHGANNKKYLSGLSVVTFQAYQLNSGAIVSHIRGNDNDGSGFDMTFLGG